MAPADKRAAITNQISTAQGNAATNAPQQPQGNSTMVPPGEVESGGKVPPSAQRKMAPVQQVTAKAKALPGNVPPARKGNNPQWNTT